MKKVCLVLSIGLLGFSTQVVSDELSPYVGLGVQMRNLPFKQDYGKESFESKMSEGEVFAGLKVNPYVGFELGYLRSVERHRSTIVSAPTTFLGVSLSGAEYVKPTTSSRVDGTNIRVVGFFPINEDVQLLGSVGLVRLRVKLKYLWTGDNFDPVYTPAQTANSTRDFTRSKYVPQAKVGIQYMLTQAIGLKALVGWDGTSRFNLLSNKQASPTRVSLKDSYTAGLGLAYYFN